MMDVSESYEEYPVIAKLVGTPKQLEQLLATATEYELIESSEHCSLCEHRDFCGIRNGEEKGDSEIGDLGGPAIPLACRWFKPDLDFCHELFQKIQDH